MHIFKNKQRKVEFLTICYIFLNIGFIRTQKHSWVRNIHLMLVYKVKISTLYYNFIFHINAWLKSFVFRTHVTFIFNFFGRYTFIPHLTHLHASDKPQISIINIRSILFLSVVLLCMKLNMFLSNKFIQFNYYNF